MSTTFTVSPFDHIRRSAEMSPCGRYRWWLRRSWESRSVWETYNGKTVCFIMLNPSTADGESDDPTIRRCIGFAKRWGYSQLLVRNLFAYRATDQKQLRALDRLDATGGIEADRQLLESNSADMIVAAWGAFVPHMRDHDVQQLLYKPVYCLDVTKHGQPRHPLYVHKAQKPLAYWNCERAD